MQKNLVYNKEAIIEVTKEFTFDSSHQLLNYVGACSRLHGHTYKLQVTFQGSVDDRGLVVDFKDIKKVVTEEIIGVLDHYNLNDKLDFNTTAENMVVYFYDILDNYIKSQYKEDIINRKIKVVEVKLWETPTSFATYKGAK